MDLPQEVMRASMTDEETARSAPCAAQSASGWSVERLLYGVALIVGVWVRLWSLGAQPLSPWEASNSWPAWLTANGFHVVDAPTPNSALYYGLQWLLFWTGVNSDSGARFISALAGIALIVLPWWWRGILGRRVAVMVAFLIAIDSWLLGFSRLADGAIVALMLGMLALVGMGQVVQQPQSVVWKRIVAVSVGLLLVAGPMGWNFVPVVLWWGWLLYGRLVEAGLLRRQWLLWLVGAALAGATMWLARLDGLAWIASGMSVWLAQFDGHNAGALLPMISGGYNFGWPWLRLWTDAALLLPLGIGGLVALALRSARNRTTEKRAHLLLLLCVGWLLWGTILCLLPGRSPLALPMLGLPLLILSACSLDALIRNIPQDVDWREVSAVMVTLIILFVSGAFWLAALLAKNSYDPVLAQAAMVILGLAVVILIAFGVWSNRGDAAWVGATMLSVLLLTVYMRSSWKLNFNNVLSEPAGWQATIAHPEMRVLVEDMETLSAHRAGDPHQLPVQVQVASYETHDEEVVPARPDPVVGWELRNMRNLTWVSSPLVAEETNPLPLVVTPATNENDPPQLDLPTEYAGSRYHVDTWWLPKTLVQDESASQVEGGGNWIQNLAAAVQPWWRWFVYREPTVAPQNRDVILWAPLDTTTGQ
jgi:GAF domain-containing protein